MTLRPETRPTRLADARVTPSPFVPATVIRALPESRLADIETAWSPVRQQLDLQYTNVGSTLESSH